MYDKLLKMTKKELLSYIGKHFVDDMVREQGGVLVYRNKYLNIVLNRTSLSVYTPMGNISVKHPLSYVAEYRLLDWLSKDITNIVEQQGLRYVITTHITPIVKEFSEFRSEFMFVTLYNLIPGYYVVKTPTPHFITWHWKYFKTLIVHPAALPWQQVDVNTFVFSTHKFKAVLTFDIKPAIVTAEFKVIEGKTIVTSQHNMT